MKRDTASRSRAFAWLAVFPQLEMSSSGVYETWLAPSFHTCSVSAMSLFPFLAARVDVGMNLMLDPEETLVNFITPVHHLLIRVSNTPNGSASVFAASAALDNSFARMASIT